MRKNGCNVLWAWTNYDIKGEENKDGDPWAVPIGSSTRVNYILWSAKVFKVPKVFTYKNKNLGETIWEVFNYSEAENLSEYLKRRQSYNKV